MSISESVMHHMTSEQVFHFKVTLKASTVTLNANHITMNPMTSRTRFRSENGDIVAEFNTSDIVRIDMHPVE